MRLFIGIAIPRPLRDEVGERIEALQRRLPAARWVSAEKLHLTLSFLGETEEAALPTLSAPLPTMLPRSVPSAISAISAFMASLSPHSMPPESISTPMAAPVSIVSSPTSSHRRSSSATLSQVSTAQFAPSSVSVSNSSALVL